MKVKIPILIGMIIIEIIVAFFVVRMIVMNDSLLEEPEKENVEIEMASFEIGELVVNPMGGRGRKFFIIEATALYNAKKSELPVIFEKKKLIVVDSLLSVMMAQDINKIQTLEGREALKVEMTGTINAILGDEIEKLLFQKFLVQ